MAGRGWPVEVDRGARQVMTSPTLAYVVRAAQVLPPHPDRVEQPMPQLVLVPRPDRSSPLGSPGEQRQARFETPSDHTSTVNPYHPGRRSLYDRARCTRRPRRRPRRAWSGRSCAAITSGILMYRIMLSMLMITITVMTTLKSPRTSLSAVSSRASADHAAGPARPTSPVQPASALSASTTVSGPDLLQRLALASRPNTISTSPPTIMIPPPTT